MVGAGRWFLRPVPEQAVRSLCRGSQSVADLAGATEIAVTRKAPLIREVSPPHHRALPGRRRDHGEDSLGDCQQRRFITGGINGGGSARAAGLGEAWGRSRGPGAEWYQARPLPHGGKAARRL
jgi:hypothetical protein